MKCFAHAFIIWLLFTLSCTLAEKNNSNPLTSRSLFLSNVSAKALLANKNIAELLTPSFYLLAKTFPTLVASFYWLKTIYLYGQYKKHPPEKVFTSIATYLFLITQLDDTFAAAYLFAGTTLSFSAPHLPMMINLLRLGSEKCPEHLFIHFLLSFYSYTELHDIQLASKEMLLAASLQNAPNYIIGLAARLSAANHTPEMALELLDTLKKQDNKEIPITFYEEHEKRLHLAMAINHLQQIVDTYQQQHPSEQVDWQILIHQGFLQQIPEDPFGEPYRIDKGHVISLHRQQQLHLQF